MAHPAAMSAFQTPPPRQGGLKLNPRLGRAWNLGKGRTAPQIGEILLHEDSSEVRLRKPAEGAGKAF